MSAFICRVLGRLFFLSAVVVAPSFFADAADDQESQDRVRIRAGLLRGSSRLSRNFRLGHDNSGFAARLRLHRYPYLR
jgi:hypothetical protein